MTSPQSFIFIGRSGCGKGTQAKLLINHLEQTDPEKKILYVETGGEFRKFMDSHDSYTKDLAQKMLDNGRLVPEFLAIYFWTNKIVSDFTSNEHLILDGSPRKYDEALVIDSLFDFYGLTKPNIIYINVSESWARGRLLERHRADDNGQDIAMRLSWFNKDVVPALEFYKKNSRYAFHDIDGERSISEIHADIRKIVGI